MKSVLCDFCGADCTHQYITVEIEDGTHPHAGEVLYTKKDLCLSCVGKFKLRAVNVNQEVWDRMRQFTPTKMQIHGVPEVRGKSSTDLCVDDDFCGNVK